MESLTIVGKVLTNPIEIQFAKDMRDNGFLVNLFTFENNISVPSTYGNINAVRRITNVPIAWKPMGNFYIIYPIIN